MADIKKAFWSFLVYPEWYGDSYSRDLVISDVSSLQIPGFVSPTHDKDIKKDGTSDKPHIHCYIKFSGPTTYNSVLSSVNKVFPEVKYIMPMDSIEGSWKYCIHAEHSTKVLYDSNDRIIINGLDIDREIKFNLSDEEKYITEILNFCELKSCFEFSHLLLFARANNPDWYKVIRANTYFFKVFMDSFRNGGVNIDYLY